MRSPEPSRSLIDFALASAVGVGTTLVGELSARISGGGPSLPPLEHGAIAECAGGAQHHEAETSGERNLEEVATLGLFVGVAVLVVRIFVFVVVLVLLRGGVARIVLAVLALLGIARIVFALLVVLARGVARIMRGVPCGSA